MKQPSSNNLMGGYFFNIPTEGNIITIRIGAAIIQMIGILLFLKWFNEHGNKEHIKLYIRYQPLILIFLVFLTPIILNSFIDSTVKAFAYAGKNDNEAVEYVKSKSSCTFEVRKSFVECEITLKNYNHSSQKVTLQMKWEKLGKTIKTPVYLLRRQEKKVSIQIPLNPLQRQTVGTKLGEQPQIIIH